MPVELEYDLRSARETFLQAVFLGEQGGNSRWFESLGPLLPFFTSNLCQFSPRYMKMTPRGATLYALAAESNAEYRMELKAPGGQLLRTFTGRTSDGIINVLWDLTDEHGVRCTNSVIDTFYHVTLPDSGRSQVLRGP